MSLPELVTIHTSLLTDLGDAVRERFGVSGDLTIEEMTDVVKGHLPSNYTLLEWIGSNGTQYINTGVSAQNGIRIVSKEALANTTHSFSIQGVTQSNDNYSMVCWGTTLNTSDFRMKLGKNGNSWTSTGVSRDLSVHIWDLQSGSQKFDGVQYATQTYSQSYSSAKPILLFGRWEAANEGTYINFAYVHIYSCQIYNGETKIRDFVPCKRKSDNVAGLYDTVGETFYTNAGSGSFITP